MQSRATAFLGGFEASEVNKHLAGLLCSLVESLLVIIPEYSSVSFFLQLKINMFVGSGHNDGQLSTRYVRAATAQNDRRCRLTRLGHPLVLLTTRDYPVGRSDTLTQPFVPDGSYS